MTGPRDCLHERVFLWARREGKCEECGTIVALDHDCFDFAISYESDGPLGHGYECGKCGLFMQAG